MPFIRPQKATSTKAFIESSMKYTEKMNNDIARQNNQANYDARRSIKENAAILEAASRHSINQDRYAKFSENVKLRLLGHSITEIAESAMQRANEKLDRKFFNHENYNTINAITYNFIRENGEASTLINNVTTKPMSTYMAEVMSTIKKTQRSVLEGVDHNDPDSFKMTSGVMDDYSAHVGEVFGHDELVDSIADRVASTLQDFVTQNAKDKEKIIAALTATKDKVESLGPDASEELKESYANLSRRFIADVRAKKHGIFNEMVVRMSKAIMKSENPNVKAKFMEGAHLNVESIVNNVATMYTFIETVNSMGLVNVDEAFITNMLNDISNET